MKSAKKTAPACLPDASKTTRPQPIPFKNIKKQTAKGVRPSPEDMLLIPIRHLPAKHLQALLDLGVRVGAQEGLSARIAALEEENRHLKSLSITDELTGLYNKRFFNRQLDVEVTRTRRTGEPFCLIFIDLDNFKLVNDTLGHARGDEFLVHICRQILHNIRPTDFACRFGGDEFAIILPATSLRDGITIAGRWHALILQAAARLQLSVSSSIGVDEFNTACVLNGEAFLHQVDQLLYGAKKSGKGKIAHPDIVIPDSKAVTWEEKEVLYHIFQPLAEKKKARPKSRGKQ
ncbi:MAG: GGDEF domain-containing protein [Smithellaceae bacterium]